MRGMDIFQKPYYREISTMRGRPMRGLPVIEHSKIPFPLIILSSELFFELNFTKRIFLLINRM